MKGNVSVLFGTETGNAKEAAEALCDELLRHGVPGVSLNEIDAHPVETWNSMNSLLIFVCSTTGQGETPATMVSSWDTLRCVDAPSLESVEFAVFGLGDSSYAKFNYTAKMLHNRLKQLGATPIVDRGLGDDQDHGGYDEEFIPWMKKLLDAMGATATGTTEIPSRIAAQFVDGEEVLAPPRSFPTIPAEVQSKSRITSADHFQEVCHIELSKENLNYQPGDALGVFPVNDEDLVVRFARRMKIDLNSTIVLNPRSGEGCLRAQPTNPIFGKPCSVGSLLRHDLEISGTCTRRFLTALSLRTQDEEERERLAELADPSHFDEFVTYSQREKRSFVEVLEDFFNIDIPFEEVISSIPFLKPRYFSISSAPCDDFISITVAKLEFTTPYKRRRIGLCSGILCAAEPGFKLECFIKKGTLSVPPDPCPMILIGPGTGIAPIRSLVRHATKDGRYLPIHVFTGNRSRTKDYLYGDEFAELNEKKMIVHHPVFSRDGDTKRYVQHLMSEVSIARVLGDAIGAGAVVALSGNSKQMPADVERCLVSIVHHFVTKGDGDDEALARRYVSRMKAEGRFMLETWSS